MTIRGTIQNVDNQGSNMAGVQIVAYPELAGPTATQAGSARTDTSGRYSIVGLKPGSYRLQSFVGPPLARAIVQQGTQTPADIVSASAVHRAPNAGVSSGPSTVFFNSQRLLDFSSTHSLPAEIHLPDASPRLAETRAHIAPPSGAPTKPPATTSPECEPPRVDERDISPAPPPPPTPVEAAIEKARARRYPDSGGALENTPCGLALEFFHPLPVQRFPSKKSDVIILGTATALQTYFSADRGRLYTEFQFVVEEGLKGWPRPGSESPGTLLVERPGGWLRLPSGRLLGDVPQDLARPELGVRYLLFLRANPEDDYSIMQGYRLEEGAVESLNPLTTELPEELRRDVRLLLRAAKNTLR